MEISIKWNICRVCLQEEQKSGQNAESGSNLQFVNLFKVNKKLAVQIFELSGVSMKPDDTLPDKICAKCLTAVNSAVQFRETCRSSNVYLQSILERTKSASTLPKPAILTCQINNDDDYDGGDSRTQCSTLQKDELENSGDEQTENATVCDEKSKYDTQGLDHQEEEIEPEPDDMSDYTVELEEIIEMSDNDDFYTETMADYGDDPSSMFENIAQNNKENSNLNESEANNEGKQYNSDANDSNLMEHGKIGQTDSNHSDEELIDNEDSISEKCMVYTDDQEETTEANIIESVMPDWEEQILNDSEDQAQVSSTVDTKEEFEYYEDNTNTSNVSSVLDKERLINENFSNCNISSTKPSEEMKEPHLYDGKTLKKKSTNEESKSPAVYPKLRMRRNLFKDTAGEPVQVCVCDICGNRFANQTKLRVHMKVHLQHKTHRCELCFKGFITACNLQAHMRIHTGEKPFECKYCGRRFNDRSSHIRHERTHTNEKPFKCVNCGKSFTLATTLQNHMKVHSNERSYRCEPCGKSFKLRHHLKTHQNTTMHHRSALKNTDDEYTYICTNDNK